MTVHELMTIGIYWDAVEHRFFQSGHVVRLLRLTEGGHIDYASWDDGKEREDGYRVLTRTIGPILQGGQFGIEPGYCVFSLLPAPPSIQRGEE